ncbi:MAG: shikimate dehydrogenase [Gemmatimonadaceae bacterium]|nr:shikimate dehydrogenase [Chitinophagaceae bacterium]
MRNFGLIGYPLSHSFSKKYFTDKFEKEGYRECTYENFQVPDEEALSGFFSNLPALSGFNITIPWKEKMLPFLHWQSPAVKSIGACNCVRIENGKTHGFNTDVKGFTDSLLPLLKPAHNKALILGTGGASKAVAHALRELGIAFLFVSRNPVKGSVTYAALDEKIISSHPLIINTTPLGMHPDIEAAPDLPYQYIGPGHYLFDLTYNPAFTSFLRKGAERGASILNGKEMLIIQAEESWRIWNAPFSELIG